MMNQKPVPKMVRANPRSLIDPIPEPFLAPDAQSIALSNMGHDLRAPLNAILGYSEMLQEQARELHLEGFVDDLAKINSAGKELVTLINAFVESGIAGLAEPPSQALGSVKASQLVDAANHEHARSRGKGNFDKPPPNGSCILVIDDDPAQRELMERFLTKEGFAVQTAANGPDGLKLAREAAPVAITLDVMMPEMDGWAVLESLKTEPALRDIPVIMLTKVDDPARGHMLGADGYATKPVDRPLMAQTMKRYAERHREITERAQYAAATMRKNEELFNVALRAAPYKLFTTDASGDIDYLSPQWMEFTGLSFEDLRADGLTKATHPHDLDENLIAWQLSVNTGKPFYFEHRFRRADGVYRWHVTRANAMLDDAGKIIMWVGSNTEIQEQKEQAEELEDRVKERTTQLELANSQMEGFTYSIAHDLRAPLRAIVFNSKVLAEELGEGLSEEHHEMLTRQAVNANKLAELIDELLKFSRLFRQDLNRTKLDLTQIAHAVVADLAPGYPTCTNFAVQEGLTVDADLNLIKFLLLNLIENACKFSPEGGEIEVGATKVDGRETYFVRDHGIGFDPIYLKKIFLPFERLVTEDQFAGTGIGLANAHRIVQLHSGRIWAESQLGKGATFFFTLSPDATAEQARK